jgi:hypothetical protein
VRIIYEIQVEAESREAAEESIKYDFGAHYKSRDCRISAIEFTGLTPAPGYCHCSLIEGGEPKHVLVCEEKCDKYYSCDEVARALDEEKGEK